MKDKEFEELIETDLTTKEGALRLLNVLSDTSVLNDEQFDLVMAKIMNV